MDPNYGLVSGSIQYQDQIGDHIGSLQDSQMTGRGDLSKRTYRASLENDIDFQRDLGETVENLKRMPGFKNKVWERIVDMHARYEQEKGERGLQAGLDARRRLQEKQRE